jgi:antitoxin FitA
MSACRDINDIKQEMPMGDMLIRGINPELKRRLEESARRNRRSLSEEAVVLLQ